MSEGEKVLINKVYYINFSLVKRNIQNKERY